ncbi:MAG: hypothetical protein ABI893_05605 [Polaromonas sp.]|uniref:hypothetical protein n=1 Tax=Polaromonas sp. TaxID=1869339 RepID=UPI003265968F
MNLNLTQLQIFLRSHGWMNSDVARFSEHVVVFTNPQHPDRELTLPTKETAPDYQDAMHVMFSKLASLEHRSIALLVREAEDAKDGHLPETSDDLILRIVRPSQDGDAIPLTLARTALKETEVLLMTSNCQALKPAPYYRRIDNKSSTSLVDRAVFNHTRHGSFVLTVSCPLLSEGEQLNLLWDNSNLPITRRSFLALHKGLEDLSSAIANERWEEFTADTLASTYPSVSANLSDAVGNIAASEEGGGIEIGFRWSPLVVAPVLSNAEKTFLFTKSNATQLYSIAAKLRPKESSLTNRFIGTVEALRGDLIDEKRSGWVELALLIPNIGIVRATAELNAQQYQIADQAHIDGAHQFIAITGTVEPRPRVWVFSVVQDFEAVNSP